MMRQYVRDNEVWRQGFGRILKAVFTSFEIDYYSYAQDHSISSSTIRYWFLGRNLPQKQYFQEFKHYLANNIDPNQDQSLTFHNNLLVYFRKIHEEESYYSLVRQNPNVIKLAISALDELYVLSKNGDRLVTARKSYPSKGTIQVIVFDFDGTIAKERKNQTTWEAIWNALGYPPEVCKNLHYQFDEGKLSHEKWCYITKEMFIAKHLHRDTLDQIAKKMTLVKGTRATFKELQERDIAIYIVSGSIMTVIQKVLGSVNQYVQEIQANVFRFDQAGFLTDIVGTQFDFEGKARYITLLSERHRISPQDILFVGNSINDRFAYLSGCRTLCVNPQLIDTTNHKIFNSCIPCMNNLKEILQFVQ